MTYIHLQISVGWQGKENNGYIHFYLITSKCVTKQLQRYEHQFLFIALLVWVMELVNVQQILIKIFHFITRVRTVIINVEMISF